MTPSTSPSDARRAGLRYVSGGDPGITRQKNGKGFLYRDARGRIIHDEATLRRIRELVIPPAWKNVWICSSRRGHLQAQGIDAKGRKQYLYHSAYRQERDLKKFNHMAAFGSALPRIRRAVARDLKLPGMPKRKTEALIVRLLDRTCIRIGNEEYARDNGSRGLTTLQDRHVRICGPAALQFHFRGKSGVEQDVTVDDPATVSLVRKSRSLRGSDLFQYRSADGSLHRVRASDVNAYLKEIAGRDITAKDFRTWHGTLRTLQELCHTEPVSSQRGAARRLSQAIQSTADQLGNRPATCRGYYIHPAVIAGYLNGDAARVRSKPPRGLAQYEAMLLTLVKRAGRQSET